MSRQPTSHRDLRRALVQMDGRGYKAYKAVHGAYAFPHFMLHIDYVQGDPFAAPSRVRVHVPQSAARFPGWAYANASRCVGLDHYLATTLAAACRHASARRGSGKSGLLAADATGRQSEGAPTFDVPGVRIPQRGSVDPSRGRRDVRVQAQGRAAIRFGEERIDLAAVSQLVHESQARAVAAALVYAWERYMDDRRTLREIVECVMADVARQGLDVLDARRVGDLAAFRPFELGAALNRLRTVLVAGKE